MDLLALKVLLAPTLIALATLAARRYGPAVGGWLSTLPLIAGPVLLIYALQHGTLFAERAAEGTLIGLLALSLFITVYARLAPHRGVAVSLLAGWSAFFALTAVTVAWRPPVHVAALLVAGALIGAAALTRRSHPPHDLAPRGRGGTLLAARVLATATLVLGLSELSGALGPQLGGILVAFPVLASLLAGFTHASDGGPAAATLLRGMITGLIGFAGFCLVAALELRALGVAAGLLAAVVASLTLHATTLPLARDIGRAQRLADGIGSLPPP